MLNEVSIFKQLSPWLYIVSSTKNDARRLLKIDIKAKTCECEHYISNKETFQLNPCKHFQLVSSVVIEAKIKNRLHFHLVEKRVKVEKILTFKKARNNVYSVTYLLSNGGKGCTFVNLDKCKDKFFVAEANPFKRGTLETTTNEKIWWIDKYRFGFQCDLRLTEWGWVRSTHCRYGVMESEACFDLYECMTSPMLPVNESLKNTYLRDVIHTPEKVEEKQPITLLHVKSQTNTVYKFVNQEQINDFRDYVSELQKIVVK